MARATSPERRSEQLSAIVRAARALGLPVIAETKTRVRVDAGGREYDFRSGGGVNCLRLEVFVADVPEAEATVTLDRAVGILRAAAFTERKEN